MLQKNGLKAIGLDVLPDLYLVSIVRVPEKIFGKQLGNVDLAVILRVVKIRPAFALTEISQTEHCPETEYII